MPGFTEISTTQLMRLIGTPDAPVVLDVCVADDIAADPFVIPTSRHVSHNDIMPLIPDLRGQSVVVVCQKGRKLSHGVAALLRAHGVTAEALAGGMAAWVAAGLPRIAMAQLPASNLWVTRPRPKIDRIACPWLIRRFVDPAAQVLLVPAADVAAVAERFSAIPFDVEKTPFSHDGDLCTFDTLLRHYGLITDPLSRMATVIRAADTDTHALAPQAAGLLALSVGLSRMYRDDTAQLEAGMLIYDALYRWARDGRDETHDWSTGRTA